MDGLTSLRIIVVTHNSGHLLAPLAACLPAATAGVDYVEVAIADSGSRDASVAIAREQFPDGTVIDLGWNAGYAAGINVAVAATTTTGPIVILNPDTRPSPGSLVRLAAGLDEARAGITVGRLVDADGTTARSLRRRPTIGRALGEAVLGGTRAGRVPALGELVVGDAAYAAPAAFDWATGAAMGISTACLEAVGPWDESFFLYSEETDFALRAAAAGYELRYVPDAVIEHAGGDALRSAPLFALLTVNRVRCYRMRHGRIATASFRLAILVGVAARALTGRATHRAALRALVRGQAAAVATARGAGAPTGTRRVTTAADPAGP